MRRQSKSFSFGDLTKPIITKKTKTDQLNNDKDSIQNVSVNYMRQL